MQKEEATSFMAGKSSMEMAAASLKSPACSYRSLAWGHRRIVELRDL